ncbi:MAG: copper chaperone PCu(A)C [Kangiellaceae bacterium]|nr:copper chaperone PCu(A)C [Kangiellaceae bacterium]
MKHVVRAFLLFSFLSGTTVSYASNSSVLDRLKVSNVSMPQTPAVSKTAAIYLSLKNQSDQEVNLVDVETTVAHHAMIHQSQIVDGIVKMNHVSNITLKPGEQLDFKRGDYHIMLMGVDKELTSKAFTVKLIFEKSGSLEFKVLGK